MKDITKPKLVFFQFKHTGNLAEFILLHRQQHIKCLLEFFNVTVINYDCDYQHICEQYQPDLTLFESGVNYPPCQRLEIENTHAHPEIPKLGFHNGDSWCEARAGFLSDMQTWGIDTFFSISITMAQYTPEIARNLFIWPNFIDADIYRDYEQVKNIPVLFTGHHTALYPWREKINKIITQHYPSLTCPHLGYEGSAVARMVYGEKYARLINSSDFVPTCGTLAKELVRKHLEIPAAKSCLITEKSATLKACGFIDMHNCVFADENDILDKLDYLYQNPDILAKITDSGYQMVQSRHTLKQRNQIFQWFNLHRQLKPGQTIIQTDPFSSLTIVDQSSGLRNSHVAGDGLMISLLRQGDEFLWSGNYDAAKALYLQCHSHIGWMPEPKFKLALCYLHEGNPITAIDWILQPIVYTLEKYKARTPDPIEWSYLVISLLCQGKLDEAMKCVNLFTSLHHSELERVRWIVRVLQMEKGREELSENINRTKSVKSIHQLPVRSFHEWLTDVITILTSSNQLLFAGIIERAMISNETLNHWAVSNDRKWLDDSTNYFSPESLANSKEALLLIAEITKNNEFERINKNNTSLSNRIKTKIKRLIKKYVFSDRVLNWLK